MSDTTIPRINQLDKNSPAELAIRNAMQEVEKLPADEILTFAIDHLNSALNFVALYVDKKDL